VSPTPRLDQLPAGPSRLAEKLARLERDFAEFRAQQLDLSAADAMLPPLDTDSTRWPQTTNAAFTSIARCAVIWHGTTLRLALVTTVTGGSTGNVRVTINGTQWGPTVAAGAAFDYTGAPPAGINLGDQIELNVEAQRLTGAGTVNAQTRLIRSIT